LNDTDTSAERLFLQLNPVGSSFRCILEDNLWGLVQRGFYRRDAPHASEWIMNY